MAKKVLSFLISCVLLFTLLPLTALAATEIPFDVIRTPYDHGYNFSGVLLHVGTTLDAGAVDKDTFAVHGKTTEPRATPEVTWDGARTITDVYVADYDGNRVDSGEYVMIELKHGCENNPAGSTNRLDYEGSRALWYWVAPGDRAGFAKVDYTITMNQSLPGIGGEATFTQNEIYRDFITDQFEQDVYQGFNYGLYKPAGASGKKPLVVWYHGIGEGQPGDTGVQLVANRVTSFIGDEFQEIVGESYVLVPQSTSSWSAANATAMVGLIDKVIAENPGVDTDRIYIGGLSMGCAMVWPVAQAIPDRIAAIIVAAPMGTPAANSSAAQIPTYVVWNRNDYTNNYANTTLTRLTSAGGSPKSWTRTESYNEVHGLRYGAHDSWVYIFNNLVKDETGETIYEWLAKQSNGIPSVELTLSTDAHLVKKGGYFHVTASFAEEVKSNTAVLNYEFDTTKFDYRGYTPAEGSTLISAEKTDTGVKIILMIPDYKTLNYGEVLLSAREDVDLENKDNEIKLYVDYVVLNEQDEKEVRNASASTTFTSTDDRPGTGEDGEVTLIDLSNMIDLFGMDKSSPDWAKYRFYDYNNSGAIDIHDISTLASRIK